MARFNPAACSRSSDAGRAVAPRGTRIVVSRRALVVLAFVGCALAMQAAVTEQSEAVLRVCADPNNMPLSNQSGEGYENKLAQELARDLGQRVEYTYFPQRMGFVRNTLRQKDAQTQQ